MVNIPSDFANRGILYNLILVRLSQKSSFSLFLCGCLSYAKKDSEAYLGNFIHQRNLQFHWLTAMAVRNNQKRGTLVSGSLTSVS